MVMLRILLLALLPACTVAVPVVCTVAEPCAGRCGPIVPECLGFDYSHLECVCAEEGACHKGRCRGDGGSYYGEQ